MANALIVGASRGLGKALVSLLLQRGDRVFGTSRQAQVVPGSRFHALRMDVTDDASVRAALREVAAEVDRLHLIVYVAGLLHDKEMTPEKKLEQIEPDLMHRALAVNAVGPMLVAKHAWPLLRHNERAVLVNMSARVGSIADNRLGGWYAYRASKAAQNMFTKTLSIELGRRARNVVVVALHPGTVDTELSRPFQRNVPEGKLFTPERSASALLHVIDGLGPEHTGDFLDYAGKPIPW